MDTKRDWSSSRAGLAGVLVGALLMSVAPALARTGDDWVLGARNGAGSPTKLISRNAVTTLRLINAGDAPALHLVTDPGVPPLQVDRGARVDHLNADRVDGRDGNDLIRAAFDAEINVSDVDGTVLSAIIRAPSRGVLMVSGSVDIFGVGTYSDIGCELHVDHVMIPGSGRRVDTHHGGGDHTIDTYEVCSSDATRVVNPGIYLVTMVMVDRDGATFGSGGLNVLFVPYDGIGNEW